MKTNHAPHAKIVQHAEGLGVPTADLVRRRALEIAKIDGRDEFNEQDWQNAKIELHGHPSPGEDEEEEMQFVSVHDMVPGTQGHHTQNQSLDDAQNIVEELVTEGMDEAVHDRMLEASRQQDTTE